MFKQCVLRNGSTYQVAWLPEHLAHINKILEIKSENGWEVIEVAQIRLDNNYIEEQSQDYKNQRKASDI